MAVVNPYGASYRAPSHQQSFNGDDDTKAPRVNTSQFHADPVTKAAYVGLNVAGALPTIGLSAPITHFEEEVHVHVRQLDREEVLQPLGVAVTSGHIGTARCVSVRLTDPRDPFFLYCMTLSENDYGRFKEAHELHVDWNGFPQNLIAMFSGVVSVSSGRGDAGAADRSLSQTVLPHQQPQAAVSLHFIAEVNGCGTLRVLERTGFRSLEHLSLRLTQQGDVGQKQYLAERFKFYEAEFHNCAGLRSDENARASKQIAELRDEVARLELDVGAAHHRMTAKLNETDLKHADEVSRLKDTHLAEVRRLYTELEADRATTESRVANATAAANALLHAARTELESTQRRLHEVEGVRKDLTRDLADCNQLLAAVSEERRRLDAEVQELREFKTQATRDRTNWELREATLTERLKHFEATSADRSTELAALRAQHETQSQYAGHLKEQLDQLTTKNNALEGNLAKMRQLFGQQQQAQAASRDKIASLTSQLQATEALVNERTLAMERAKQEQSLIADKLEMANSKLADMKAAAADSDATREKLAAQLRQNEDALLHMQRLGTTGGVRSWSMNPSALSASPHAAMGASSTVAGSYNNAYMTSLHRPPTAGPAGSSPTPPAVASTAGLFRDFARGASAVPSSGLGAQNATGGIPTPAGGHSLSSIGVFVETPANVAAAPAGMFGSTPKPIAVATGKAAPPPTSAYFPSLSS